jgi:hypothetical protein
MKNDHKKRNHDTRVAAASLACSHIATAIEALDRAQRAIELAGLFPENIASIRFSLERQQSVFGDAYLGLRKEAES